MEYRAKSTKYVSGEIEEMALPQTGSSSIGMNTPLMKIRGNLIMDDSIIMVAGLSVGG